MRCLGGGRWLGGASPGRSARGHCSKQSAAGVLQENLEMRQRAAHVEAAALCRVRLQWAPGRRREGSAAEQQRKGGGRWAAVELLLGSGGSVRT